MSNRLLPLRRAAIVLLLFAALGITAERERWFSRLLSLGTPERLWVWVAASPREIEPRAFFLARDFAVTDLPAAARLEIAADPEYVVRLNGRRIGSACYRPGAPFDVYEVGGALRRGRNRLLVELRSPIGSGGMSLRLADGAGRAMVVSDRDWRVYGGVWRSLTNLDAPLFEAPRALVIGSAPLARWGFASMRSREAYLDLVERDDLLPAQAWRPVGGDAAWRPMPKRKRQTLPAGDLVEIDFGREVAGYLHLDVQPETIAEGMLFFGHAAGERLDRAPDRVVVAVPNLGFWQDVAPRRFRFLTIVGLTALRAVSVIELRPEVAERLADPESEAGLFGLPAEPARSPLVEELRRRVSADAPGGG